MPADASKIYVINGYKVTGTNDAAHACSTVQLMFTSYYDGKTDNLEAVSLTPNQVVSNDSGMILGLNVPCMPGTAIYMYTDAAAATVQLRLYYTQVDI